MEKRRVYVHLFIDSEASVEIEGEPVRLVQRTGYPFDERVTIEIDAPQPSRFSLCVRVPGWCSDAVVRVNGASVPGDALKKNGYVVLDRRWTPGDLVELTLPMPAKRVYPHPKIRQDAGRVAIQRGPIVYCLEEADNGPDLHEMVLRRADKLRVKFEGTDWGVIPVVRADAIRRTGDDPGIGLYRTALNQIDRRAVLTAIPYYLWANRGMAEMIVWIRDGA